jgi:tetratricopeptide (TPR) repeat protein
MNVDAAGAIASEVDARRRAYELEQAEDMARAALLRFPDNPGLLMSLGRVLVLEHRLDEAFAIFTAAADRAPGDDGPAGWQVATRTRGRHYAEALRLGTAALARLPGSVTIRVAIGRVYLDSSRPGQALEYLRAAVNDAPDDAQAADWLCAGLAAQFQWDKAVSVARAFIERHPDSVRVRYRLGRVYVDDQRPAQALEQFNAVLAMDRAHARAQEWRITALRAMRRFDEAEQSAMAAVAQYRYSPWLRIERAWAFADQGRYEDANDEVKGALYFDVLSPWAQRSRIDFLRLARRYDEAENAARVALELIPGEPRLLTAAAVVYADQGKYADAIDLADQALAIDPLNSWAHRSKVDFLRHAYRVADAEQAAREAIAARPDDPRIHVTAAWVASTMGRFDVALERAAEALAIDPANSWALCSRIDFERQAHQFRRAEQAVLEALSARPADPDVHVAAAWVSSAQDREAEADARVAEALEIDPGHPVALAARIYFLRWAHRLAEAQHAAGEAMTRRPKDPDVLAAAGWVASDLGRNAEALRYARMALEIDPCNSWVLNCRVNFLRAAGRYDAAEWAALRALSERPGDPYLYTALGWLNGDRNRYETALGYFGQALEANPWHLEALEWRIATLRSYLKLDQALIAAKDAVRIRAQDPSLAVELGRVHDVRLEFGKALAEYERILANDPGDVGATIAKSAALRARRGYEQAEREVTALLTQLGDNRDLRAELGWIKFDQRDEQGARREFEQLLRSASNDRDRAAAHYGMGWADFAAEAYVGAMGHFREAVTGWRHDSDYKLGLAWSLALQDKKGLWQEAADIAYEVAGSRPDPFAHACLGVLAFRRGRLGDADYHLRRTLDLDEYQGSYTDLGALYVQTARYAEAADLLRKAVDRDWYDAVAHVELGTVALRRGGDHLRDAEHEFRQALAAEPARSTAVRAVLGLAEALAREGSDSEAETVLRMALEQPDTTHWRVYEELAWSLLRQADRQQNSDVLEDAYRAAQQAIRANGKEPEPYLVAGLVQYHMAMQYGLAAVAREPLARRLCLSRARKHLSTCLRYDKDNIDARRYLDALKREVRRIEPAFLGAVGLAVVSVSLLALTWTMFIQNQRITATDITVFTPILLGLLTISPLLPTLIRLKMPGFEADLQPQAKLESHGPTGEDFFGPGRFTVPGGPTGQVPRRGQARLQATKSTKHASA